MVSALLRVSSAPAWTLKDESIKQKALLPGADMLFCSQLRRQPPCSETHETLNEKIATSMLAAGYWSGINQPKNKVEDRQFIVWECFMLLTLLNCMCARRLDGQELPRPWMPVALGSATAVSVRDSLVRHPQELLVPFVVEQWDLKRGKEFLYNKRRARKEISWEATHQSPGGVLRKNYPRNFARFLIV